MAIFLIARLVTGRSLASGVPLLIVTMLELINEALDRVYQLRWDWPDTLGDIAVTLFWPLVLTIAARIASSRQPQSALSPRA